MSVLSRWLWLLFAIYIVYGATFPFGFTAKRSVVTRNLSHMTANPFVSPATGRIIGPDIAQNVLLFMPFGILGALAFDARARPTIGRRLCVIGLAAVLSACVEALQLFTVDRTSSVADFAADSFGAAAGVLMAPALVGSLTAFLARFDARRFMNAPAFYPTLVALAIVCAAAWEPFDFSFYGWLIKAKLRALMFDPWQAGFPTDEGVNFLRFALLTLAGSTWLKQLGVRDAALMAAAGGAIAGMILESSQIIIDSRMPGLGDALTSVVGAVAGALLSAMPDRQRPPRFWFAILLVATWPAGAMLLMARFWVFTSQAIEVMLIFFPVGFTLSWLRGVAPRRFEGRDLAAAIGLAVGMELPMELVRVTVAGRSLDLTNAVLAATGCVLGAWLGTGPGLTFLRRAGFPPPAAACSAGPTTA